MKSGNAGISSMSKKYEGRVKAMQSRIQQLTKEKAAMSSNLAKLTGRQSKYKTQDPTTQAARSKMRARIKALEGNISASRFVNRWWPPLRCAVLCCPVLCWAGLGWAGLGWAGLREVWCCALYC